MRRELRAFEPDVVHVHEPPAGPISWDALSYPGRAGRSPPSTPTRPSRCSITSRRSPGCAASSTRPPARIAVSEAAAWTGRRWFGGEYTVIPNGVDLAAAPQGPKPQSERLRLLFVGRPEERKGLPVLLSAFAALVEHVDAELIVVGSERSDGAALPLGSGRRGADPRSRARQRRRALARDSARPTCSARPSLLGESFGMVLTEAFAAGTPVVASNIAGYADVVTDGADGILVPPADPQASRRDAAAPQPRAAIGSPRWAPRRARRRSATPGRVSPSASRASMRRAVEVPEPRSRSPSEPRAASGFAPANGRPPVPGRAPGVARARAGVRRVAAAGSRGGSRSASPASSASA